MTKQVKKVNKMKKSSNIEKIKNIPTSNKKTNVKPIKPFPSEFPFWARLKISKNRTTLIIDKDFALNKKTKKFEDGFVHREATSQYHKGYEEILPNPDKDKRPEPMYLKRPKKIPNILVKPHNKDLEMPSHLKDRYNKNNKK